MLSTLQDPSLEVHSLSQMISTDEKLAEKEAADPETTPPDENRRPEDTVAHSLSCLAIEVHPPISNRHFQTPKARTKRSALPSKLRSKQDRNSPRNCRRFGPPQILSVSFQRKLRQGIVDFYWTESIIAVAGMELPLNRCPSKPGQMMTPDKDPCRGAVSPGTDLHN